MMGFWSFTLVRPSAFLCASLVLLVFFFPDTCLAGKKIIPPVKHLFGVGIGYQKVVHYKPVLVISKSRHAKRRPAGWGWSGGGSGAQKSYSPVVIQQHVHKHGESGYSHGHQPPPQHHRRKRKRPLHHRLRLHSSRGWGWRQGWKRPRHSKGHGGGSGGNIENIDGYNHHHHHHSVHSSGHDYPLHHDSHHHHHEISDNPPSVHHHDEDYRPDIWGGGALGGRGSLVYPAHSANYYGSPYSSIDEHEELGGYESEIKEQWKKEVPTTPTTFPPTSSTAVPTPPAYPFTDEPKNDGGVTNMHKDFLKNHMTNFHQFQDYQEATTNQPRDKDRSHFAPGFIRPPGPYFSTVDPTPQSSSFEAEETGNGHYDHEEYSDEVSRNDAGGNGGAENYDYDYNGSSNNELNRKMTTSPHHQQHSTQFSSSVQPQPTLASNAMTSSTNINNFFQQEITAMPKNDNDKMFKPSPRVEDMGSGNSFNRPGFFPTFEQFQNIKMT